MLAAAKAGRRVSVGIPARDEQDTIRPIVAAIRGELIDGCGLVDEVAVLVDTAGDPTVPAARAAGADVVVCADVLPEFGPVHGKGDALWRSLAVLSGDIVVFVDADIVDYDNRFVTGIVGPLLDTRECVFVKGFYDRPLRDATGEASGEGGRVTELVARPLLNALLPEAADLVQPLAGEYGGMASALRSVPFCTGYGVEIGLVVDIVTRYGAARVAQVDLGIRRHRNRPLADLAPMACQVTQAALLRLAAAGRVGLPGGVGSTLRRFTVEGALDTDVKVDVRPALDSVVAR